MYLCIYTRATQPKGRRSAGWGKELRCLAGYEINIWISYVTETMQNAKLIADGNPKKEKKNKYDKRKRKTFRTFSAYFVCKSVAKNQTKTKKQKCFFSFLRYMFHSKASTKHSHTHTQTHHSRALEKSLHFISKDSQLFAIMQLCLRAKWRRNLISGSPKRRWNRKIRGARRRTDPETAPPRVDAPKRRRVPKINRFETASFISRLDCLANIWPALFEQRDTVTQSSQIIEMHSPRRRTDKWLPFPVQFPFNQELNCSRRWI